MKLSAQLLDSFAHPGEAEMRPVRSTPFERGKGVFWWEPAVEGALRTRGFFDDEGNALPVMSVFDNSSGN